MKICKLFLCLLCSVVLLGSLTFAKDLSEITAILKVIDEQSVLAGVDLSSLMTMVVEDPDKGVEKLVIRQFRRDEGEHSLLIIQEPSLQKGQGYLLEGDNLWFYDPSSRKFAHSSLKENFQSSDARNADFNQCGYASSYQVKAYEEGTLGQFAVYIIDLEATNDTVPFPFLKIWVTKEGQLVLKKEEYSLNHRLMRTSLFPKYTKVANVFLPVQMLFIDELVEGKKTQIAISEISTNKIPDHVFTKAYVERVSR